MPIPGEEDPGFLLDDVRQVFVRIIGTVQGIEAQHAEEGSQPTEMTIEQEKGIGRGTRFHWKDRHPVTIVEAVAQTHPKTINQDGSHLTVRDAQGFDQVLDGLMIGKGQINLPTTHIARQKIGQIPVKRHFGGYHREYHSAERRNRQNGENGHS